MFKNSFITLPLSFFVIVSTAVLVIGILGIIVQRNNIIALLLSLELILLASFLLFLFCAFYLIHPLSFVYAIILLSLAGAESAVGLGLLVVYYRKRDTADVISASFLRG